jgi:hypothetical protein
MWLGLRHMQRALDAQLMQVGFPSKIAVFPHLMAIDASSAERFPHDTEAPS